MPRRDSDAGSDGVDEWFEVGESSTSGQPSTEAATQTEVGNPPVAGTVVSPTIGRWIRLIRSCWNIRRLQRIFHNTGQRLQDFPQPLREGISKAYPKK